MSEDLLTTIIVAVIMVIGLVGTLIPVLPGILAMWAIAVIYGFVMGWTTAGFVAIVLITGLTLASLVVGYLLPQRAAADAGAGRWSQFWGVVGAIAGFFAIPIVGVIVGALAGVLVAEWAQKGELGPAWTSTVATAKGFGISALVQFGIGFAMLLAWSAWAVTLVA